MGVNDSKIPVHRVSGLLDRKHIFGLERIVMHLEEDKYRPNEISEIWWALGAFSFGTPKLGCISEAFSVFSYNPESLKVETMPTKCCPTCLKEFQMNDVIITLWCAHAMHWTCKPRWNAEKTKCPICKAPPMRYNHFRNTKQIQRYCSESLKVILEKIKDERNESYLLQDQFEDGADEKFEKCPYINYDVWDEYCQ